MINGLNNNMFPTQQNNKTQGSLGKDDFMKLLITQLKAQDPLNPMESADFAAQLAQFTSLEKLTNINENIKMSLDANYMLTQSINNTMTSTFIGKEVKLSTDEILYTGQDKISIGYDLPDDVTDVKIKIYDDNGLLITTIDGSTAPGSNRIDYDFKDADGNNISTGKYRFEVEATNNHNEKVDCVNYIVGRINGIKFGEQGTKLIVNGVEYVLGSIIEIIEPVGVNDGRN